MTHDRARENGSRIQKVLRNVRSLKTTSLSTVLCAIGVSMLVLMSGSVHGNQASIRTESLLRTGAISNDIGGIEVSRLAYSSGHKVVSVILLPGRLGIGGVTVRPLEHLRLQVWLLKRNGTTVPHKMPSSPSRQMAGFLFDDILDAELEGVIVSVDGTLFVRKMTGGLAKT